MFFGPQPATIVGVTTISIHGERLHDVAFQVDGEAAPRTARLGPEALYGVPEPGDRVRVRFLMETVTRIEREMQSEK
jgi:hypothetical protein